MALFNEESFLVGASAREKFESADEIDPFLSSLSPRRGEMVALDGAVVAAYGGLFAMTDRLSHGGWIMLGVREAYQGRGLGRKLVVALVMLAMEMGLRRVQLTVWADNARAIRLYESVGFAHEGRHRDFLRRGETYVDALTMAYLPPAP